MQSHINILGVIKKMIKWDYRMNSNQIHGVYVKTHLQSWPLFLGYTTQLKGLTFFQVSVWGDINWNPLSAAIIALPPSNAFLERIFSACSWCDDPLLQRLKDDRFEKAVLIAVNESLISGVSTTKEKVKGIVETVVLQSD